MNNYNFEPSESVWVDHYRGVYRTNQIIANVPGMPIDESIKKRIVAEARFLRGLYYFNLGRSTAGCRWLPSLRASTTGRRRQPTWNRCGNR
jgi:hypothetical protein